MDNKHWGDFTFEEIRAIEDKKIQREYLDNWNNVVRNFVNPLVGSSKFKFTTSEELLTCRIMMKELFDHYQKMGYTREEILLSTVNNDHLKKH